MIKVSVIMPVYNTNNEEVLKKSIFSIIDQSLKNFELIICDDCSTDGTYEIVKKIVKEINDDRITLLRNEKNLGVSETRNKCLSIACGEYIALQDCDDYSDVKRLEKQALFLEQRQDCDFISSRIYLVEEDNISISKKYIKCPQAKDFLYTLPFCHAASMIRRDVFVNLGGYRIAKETILRAEDYDLFMRLYAYGSRGEVLEDVLYYYRLNMNTNRKKYVKYAYHEMCIRYKRFKDLKLLPKGLPYVLKPLLGEILSYETKKKIRLRFCKQYKEQPNE